MTCFWKDKSSSWNKHDCYIPRLPAVATAIVVWGRLFCATRCDVGGFLLVIYSGVASTRFTHARHTHHLRLRSRVHGTFTHCSLRSGAHGVVGEQFLSKCTDVRRLGFWNKFTPASSQDLPLLLVLLLPSSSARGHATAVIVASAATRDGGGHRCI